MTPAQLKSDSAFCNSLFQGDLSKREQFTLLAKCFTDRISALQEAHSAHQREFAELQTFSKEASSTLQTLIKTVEIQKRLLSEAAKYSNDLEKQILIANHQYRESKAVAESEDQATNEKLEAMNRLFEESQQQLQAQIQDQKNQLNALKTENQARKTELYNVRVTNNALGWKIVDLPNNSPTLQQISNQIDLLKKDNDQQNERLQTGEAQAQRVQQHLENLSQALAGMGNCVIL